MAAQWPTSVATDSNLYVAVNELQNALSAGINNSVTTIGINSTTGFPTVGLVLIDSEIIKYTGISGNNLTSCTRAFDGTTAATHSSAAIVSFAFCADHHNVLKDEIEAVETYLSANLGTGATPLTASRVLVSDSSKKITSSSVTSTTLGYLDATSSIQTQLDGKQASGTYVANPLTADLAAGSHKLTGLSAGSSNGDSVRYEQVIGVFLPLAGGTMTGNLTFDSTHGVVGRAAANNAATGNVGEVLSASVVRSAAQSISGGSGATNNITSLSITAGDWDVVATVAFTGSGFTATTLQGSISTTSATQSGADTVAVPDSTGQCRVLLSGMTLIGLNDYVLPTIKSRVSISTPTTYYLVAGASFSVATPAIFGSIVARRC